MMKTYTQLLGEYKALIQTGIDDYQALFSEKKPMGLHRANNIEELQEILDRVEESELLKERLTKALDEFKTGVLFIRTGHSKLKKSIKQKLEQPQFSEKNFLIARVFELESKNQNLQQNPNAPIEALGEDSDNSPRLQLTKANQRIQELQMQIKILQTSVTSLEKENIQLKLQNQALYETTINDQKEGERKRQRETQSTILTTETILSPSSSIHGSFSDLNSLCKSETHLSDSEDSHNEEKKFSNFFGLFQ